MLELPPRRHLLATGIQAFLDLSVLLLAFIAAYMLRFDFKIPPEEIRNFITQMPLVVLLQFVALTICGARSSIWRYTDLANRFSTPPWDRYWSSLCCDSVYPSRIKPGGCRCPLT